MFWKLFSSDRRVTEALQCSTGYNAFPSSEQVGQFVQIPANTDDFKLDHQINKEQRAEHGFIEYCYILPEQKKSGF